MPCSYNCHVLAPAQHCATGSFPRLSTSSLPAPLTPKVELSTNPLARHAQSRDILVVTLQAVHTWSRSQEAVAPHQDNHPLHILNTAGLGCRRLVADACPGLCK